MKKLKIVMEIEAPDELTKGTGPWETLEDELRDFIIERFEGAVEGSIKDELTGNSTKICVPKCPHCGKPVMYLENEQDLIAPWEFHRNGEYSAWPKMEEAYHIGDVNRWVCPHCREVIAEDEDKALDFLNCR